MFSLLALMFSYIFLLLSPMVLVNANLSGPFGAGDSNQELAPRALANGAPLRILCLGASITYGYESTDGNGYRYGLRGALVSGGNEVDMIGSLTHGTMNNNQVEGWDGYRIAEVAQKAELSLSSMPNLVLINAGTNDMAQNFDVATAHIRMGNLVDRIFQVVPNTAIVVSTLLPNADESTQANVLVFNKNLVGTVAQRAAAGKNIILVDMSSDWFSVADLHEDGTHPTDEGYLKMAKVFYNGIVGLGAQISSPLQAAGVNDMAAKNDIGAGSALDAVCQTVSGQKIPTAQGVQCKLNMATTSAVASSAISSKPASTTPSTTSVPSAQIQTLLSASSVPASPSTTSSSSIVSSTQSSTSVSLPLVQSSNPTSESVLGLSSTAPPTSPSSTASSTFVLNTVKSPASTTTTSLTSQTSSAKSSAPTNSSYSKYINMCLFIALLLANGGFHLASIDL